MGFFWFIWIWEILFFVCVCDLELWLYCARMILEFGTLGDIRFSVYGFFIEHVIM